MHGFTPKSSISRLNILRLLIRWAVYAKFGGKMAYYLQLFLSLTLIRMPTVKQSQEDILANSIENLDVTEEVEDMEESWNKDQIQDLITLSG